MSSINSLSTVNPQSYMSSLSAIQDVGSQDSDSSDQSTAPPQRAGGHHHGGGGMGHALMETMQQLGLSPSSSSSSSDSSSDSDSSTSDTTTGSTSSTSTGDLRSDLGAFMTQLFQAMRSEASGSTDTSNSSSTTASSSVSATSSSGPLGGALSALTTAVANGTAPAGLQSAFNQLMQDMQSSSSDSSSSSSTSSTSTSSTSSTTSSGQPSLQDFLTTLAQNMSHHGQGQMAVGNVVNTQV